MALFSLVIQSTPCIEARQRHLLWLLDPLDEVMGPGAPHAARHRRQVHSGEFDRVLQAAGRRDPRRATAMAGISWPRRESY